MPFYRHTKLRVYPGEGLTGYWYVGFPDFVEFSFLDRFLREGEVFYDIGSNAGAYTVFAAGAGCEVYAFEPVPSTWSRLQENVALNVGVGHIHPQNLAVGAKTGRLRMTLNFGTGNRVLAGGDSIDPESELEVPAVSLDDFAATRPTPGFVKIDVEGHELEVLRGSFKVLASASLKALLVETFRPHRRQDANFCKLERILRDFAFRPFDFDPIRNQLTELVSDTEGRDNTFYIRETGLVEERLAERCGLSLRI